jgi:hypothetical protein
VLVALCDTIRGVSSVVSKRIILRVSCAVGVSNLR